MAEAGNFSAGRRIDQGDRLRSQVCGKQRAVGGEGALQAAGGADRTRKAPDQGSGPGIPTGEGIQVSGEELRSVGMETDGGFGKSGREQLEPGVFCDVPDDDPVSFLLGCCDESGIRADRHGIQQGFYGRERACGVISGLTEQANVVTVSQGDGAMKLTDGQVIQIMPRATGIWGRGIQQFRGLQSPVWLGVCRGEIW